MNFTRAPKFTRASSTCRVPPKCRVQSATVPPEILVIEDGSGLFPKIGAMLQSQGFQVILAPNADTALQEITNYDIAAVIAGASRDQYSGLHVLAAAKEKRAEVKTMVVTRLVDPELPVQAYEMEIDDYLHWPLSGAELTARLRELLELEAKETIDGRGPRDDDAHAAHAYGEIGSLLDRFTNSLSIISQSLEDLQQEHREGMAENLSEELSFIAAQIQNLGDSLRQCWSLGTAPPASKAKTQSVH